MTVISPRDKAIEQYHRELEEYRKQGVETRESSTRFAFHSLLARFAPSAGWTVIAEQPLPNGKRPDATLRDNFTLPRGYWEAKDTDDDLDAEIRKKITAGYPTINTIFEDTQWAILYQSGRTVDRFDLRQPRAVADLLNQFFGYTEPHIESFEQAVADFKDRIPELAQRLLDLIRKEHAENKRFRDAFAGFYAVCATSLDPNIKPETIQEMLVQHLLTERLFRTVFNNPNFTRRNVIAAEIEKVIDALTSRAFNRDDFQRRLDRFYVAIEAAAKGLEDWSEKQTFMNMVYERFFQGFSAKQADTHGIVYTPQEIVDFMCASVEEVLQREFGASLSAPGVQILDPCTGTGNFIVNLIRRISGANLRVKYASDLFANEIMLLPYYIASLNIEHAYYERMGEYRPFEGLCFTDTLDLAEGRQMQMFTEPNTERVEREKAAQIMVVIGNPPYNVGQENENDNNKNRRYRVIDGRIQETYVRESSSTLRAQLYDAYVRFFRWASDRLQGRDGIVCFVSNNSFIDQLSFNGMRKHVAADFTQIYHLDLHGNVRKNPKLSGTTHNVFGIQVGVGITIAVRATGAQQAIRYYRVPDDWRREQKLSFLATKSDITSIDWTILEPDKGGNWLTAGLHPEFGAFPALGTREAKAMGIAAEETGTLFRTYSNGVESGRDAVVYNFNQTELGTCVAEFIEEYDSEVSRWVRAGRPQGIDGFVRYEKLKWSRNLKRDLAQEHYIQFDSMAIRRCLYRPFTSIWLYYADVIVDERGTLGRFLPTSKTEAENMLICVKTGTEWPFFALATRILPARLPQGGSQCFPFYTYAEDGSNRRENITDWALGQFQARYGAEVSKWDIFHYVYSLLHHPQYRARYAENLKRELPRIPLLGERAHFDACVHAGRELMRLHLDYEQVREYPFQWIESRDVPISWHVEKMKLSPDKTSLRVNDWLTLAGIPADCFAYRLGNRSALNWIIDQYQVSTDARSGIASDPNRADDPEYIARLVGRVVQVSVETVRLINELARSVSLDALTS